MKANPFSPLRMDLQTSLTPLRTCFSDDPASEICVITKQTSLCKSALPFLVKRSNFLARRTSANGVAIMLMRPGAQWVFAFHGAFTHHKAPLTFVLRFRHGSRPNGSKWTIGARDLFAASHLTDGKHGLLLLIWFCIHKIPLTSLVNWDIELIFQILYKYSVLPV